MADPRESEYEAFSKLIEHIKGAIDQINKVGVLRQDRRWAKISANMSMTLELVYKLAGTGWTKR